MAANSSSHETVTAPRGGDEEDLSLIPAEEEERCCAERFITPRVVLCTFTLLNFFTYLDRGALAGSLSAIRVDPALRPPGSTAAAMTDAQGGAVVSGFMIGYMVSCPLFSALGGRFSSRVIILFGMVVWSVACIGTALSPHYWVLLLCRMFVGVGEAAFVGFTVTIIDNIAPPTHRTRWIGTFYAMIPLGTAVGMAVGGVCGTQASPDWLPLAMWRVPFIVEVLASLLVLVMIACMPAAYHLPRRPVEEYISLPRATAMLVKNGNYVLIVLGLATYTFVVGALSVWAIPMLVQGPLHIATITAAVFVGSSTALAGLVGTLAGGTVLDAVGGSEGEAGCANCQLFNVAMIVVCIPFSVLALYTTNVSAMMVSFALAVLALFCTTAPANASILTVVPSSLRPYAVGYSVFVIHLLGDFPSPTVAGVLSDHFSNGCPALNATTCTLQPSQGCYWVVAEGGSAAGSGHCVNQYQLRNALLIVFLVLLLAIPLWGAACLRLRAQAKRREQEEAARSFLVVGW